MSLEELSLDNLWIKQPELKPEKVVSEDQRAKVVKSNMSSMVANTSRALTGGCTSSDLIVGVIINC